jgi:hypothetical protein
MIQRSIASAVLAATFSILAAPEAHADPESASAPPIHVVAIRADNADDQAEALTVALRNRVRALRGWSLGEGDHSLEILTLGLKCGEVPDEGCQAKIGQQIRADRYIWGTVRRLKAGQVRADVHLWARGKAATAVQLTYSDNLTAPGDDALKRLVDGALAKLVGVGEKGTVVVRSRAASSGDLYVDGNRSGVMQKGEIRLDLAPGTHAIELRAAGAIQKGTVNVRAGSTVELLLAQGGAASKPVAPVGPGANASPGPESNTTHGSSKVIGWAALGMGVVLTGGGIYSMARIRQIDSDEGFDRYRQGFRPDQDVCDEARAGAHSAIPGAAAPDEVGNLCSEASSLKTLQYVFLGLGAVSTGAGIYLLVRNPRPEASAAIQGQGAEGSMRWHVTPQVGRSAAGLQLRLAF